MLAVNEEKVAVAAEKSDHVVCVFRLDSFDDVEAVGEALKRTSSCCWILRHVMRSVHAESAIS